MPYAPKKYKRRSTRKPAYRKKRTTRSTYANKSARRTFHNQSNTLIAGGTKSSIQRGYLPFGRNYFARLPYVENFPSSASTLSPLSTVGFSYRLNSCFDPRYQVGGHQPLQYDSMALQYKSCLVHGAKFTITFNNPTSDGFYVGYRVRDTKNSVPTAGQEFEYIQEMRDSPCRALNDSGSQKVTFQGYASMHKVIGLRKDQYDPYVYGHDTGSNPAGEVLLEPWIIMTQGTTVETVRVNVKITYFCQFFDPITAPQS